MSAAGDSRIVSHRPHLDGSRVVRRKRLEGDLARRLIGLLKADGLVDLAEPVDAERNVGRERDRVLARNRGREDAVVDLCMRASEQAFVG